MSNFFKSSDLSRNEAENIISETLNKCDVNYIVYESKNSSVIIRSNSRKYDNVKYEYNSKVNAWNHFIEKNNKWESNLEFYVNEDRELDVKNST